VTVNAGFRKRDDIAGVVLAGGRNTRFPIQKGFIRIDGAAIIERDISIMRPFFREVMISTNMPEAYFYLGAPLVGDVLPSNGPMSGIYTALINSCGAAVFVVACDMPFIDPGVMSLVCDKHEALAIKECCDATIPIFNGEPQPLLGIYRDTALPVLESGILTDRAAMKPFLGEIRTHYIDESDVRAVDPEGRSFININTEADFNVVMCRQGRAFSDGRERREFNIQEGAC